MCEVGLPATSTPALLACGSMEKGNEAERYVHAVRVGVVSAG